MTTKSMTDMIFNQTSLRIQHSNHKTVATPECIWTSNIRLNERKNNVVKNP
jgi:hypothetical protein